MVFAVAALHFRFLSLRRLQSIPINLHPSHICIGSTAVVLRVRVVFLAKSQLDPLRQSLSYGFCFRLSFEEQHYMGPPAIDSVGVCSQIILKEGHVRHLAMIDCDAHPKGRYGCSQMSVQVN